MKGLSSLLLGILLLINSGCEKEIKKDIKLPQQKTKKNIQIVKRKVKHYDIKDLKDFLKKNKNFIKLYESYSPETYSIDELVDLTKENLKLYKLTKSRRFPSKIDTPPIKSRLVLSEINLKKLNFLLNKNKIEPDTIEKILNTVVKNLNSVVDNMRLYTKSYDEFEEILSRDSIIQSHKNSRDSLLMLSLPSDKSLKNIKKKKH